MGGGGGTDGGTGGSKRPVDLLGLREDVAALLGGDAGSPVSSELVYTVNALLSRVQVLAEHAGIPPVELRAHSTAREMLVSFSEAGLTFDRISEIVKEQANRLREVGFAHK